MSAPALPMRFVLKMRQEAEQIGQEIQRVDREISEAEQRVAGLSVRRDRMAQDRKELLDVIGHEPGVAEIEWSEASAAAWLKGEAP